MDALLVSTSVVALAEIGDKTQLLAFALAARYRAPWPVAAGIFLATLANHALAATGGVWLADLLTPAWLAWAVGLSFLAMAAWVLVPDKPDEGLGAGARLVSPFWATLVAFFLVEIGDKTQVATIALAARYEALLAVVAGTTLGMMLANLPVVFCGGLLAGRLDARWMRRAAAALFAALGAASLLAAGGVLRGGPF
jgi:putative Ca2+/H+ antiporter (TMEM165/GDT1 family)